ncbi:MAG: class I SAM-dependent methyltransferase [Geobacter sp.]|nr:class I SAM-dependent methyltransferase [Geobacter sp.]
MLAFLVNESRAKNAEKSGDIYARSWVPPKLQYAISAAWNEFSKEVYNKDDTVLSIRNRIILETLKLTVNSDTQCIIMPCGMVSYPMLLNVEAEYLEVDVAELIAYKRHLVEDYEKRGEFPRRSRVFLAADICNEAERKGVLARTEHSCKKVFILEGISYYLDIENWWSVIKDVIEVCSKGDVIVFDYWPYEERFNEVYEKFRHFCNNHMMCQIERFLFLTKEEIIAKLYSCTVKFESVVDAQKRVLHTRVLKKDGILCDTCVIATIK